MSHRSESLTCLRCGGVATATVFGTRGGRLGGFVSCVCNYKCEGTRDDWEALKVHLEALPVWDGEFECKVGARFVWEVKKKWLEATVIGCVAPFHSAKSAMVTAGEHLKKLPFMDRSARPRYILKCVDGDKEHFRSPPKGRVESMLEAMGD